MNRFAFRVTLAVYLLLLVLAATTFEAPLLFKGITFIAVNAAISSLYFSLLRRTDDVVYHHMAEGTFFVAFIAKGVIQHTTGLNTLYTGITVRTFITDQHYTTTLAYVTIAHAVVVFVLILASRFSRTSSGAFRTPAPSKATINLALIAVFIWVLATSVIMFSFGVAVMGTESVALPFRLSGIFYYSRLLVIPLVLLYFLHLALITGDSRLARSAFALLVLLALSDTFIRASKSPLFILALQLATLYALLLTRKQTVVLRMDKTRLAVLFFAGMVIWPAVEVYREMVVAGDSIFRLTANLRNYLEGSDSGLIGFALERFFQRLVGFLQFAGLVAIDPTQYSLADVLTEGNIARLYTHRILGYATEGHLSSPSLLGTSLLLGGRDFWLAVVALYFAMMAVIWHIVLRLPRFGIAAATVLGFEICNTIIAGTVDSSLERIALLIASALALEAVFSVLRHRRQRVAPRSL